MERVIIRKINLKRNLHVLMDENPDGIWLNQLSSKYQKKFGPLKPNYYGFDSPADLSLKLPDIFTYKRHTSEGDYLLLDARKFKPDAKDIPIIFLVGELKKIFEKLKRSIFIDELDIEYQKFYGKTLDPKDYGFLNTMSLLRILQTTTSFFRLVKVENRMMLSLNETIDKTAENINRCDEVLDSIQFNYFSDEVCNADTTLELDPIYSQIKKGLRIAVKIAEVYSPEHFYVHREEKIYDLNIMMENLHYFYEINEKKYEVLPDLVQAKLLCACRFATNGKWHRVSVRRVLECIKVEVRYIDYGTVEVVPCTNLRYLHTNFARIPAMAIKSKLTSIKPKIINSLNTSDNDKPRRLSYLPVVCFAFHDILVENHLVAKVVHYDVTSNCVEMDIKYTAKDGKIFSVRTKLIEDGLIDKKKVTPAIWRMFKLETKKIRENSFAQEFDDDRRCKSKFSLKSLFEELENI